jgi:hypothetical protein
MRAGGRVSVYVSQALADDLDLLTERFPGERAPSLVRRALAYLAGEAVAERAAAEAERMQRGADGVAWN